MAQGTSDDTAAVGVGLIGAAPFAFEASGDVAWDLIRQLHTASICRQMPKGPYTASLELLSGGRSGAIVFKVIRFCDGRPEAPVVVKISPLHAGQREFANYHEYVLPRLPPGYRPELLGTARAGDHVALCYSFFGAGGGAATPTLTDWLKRGDPAKLHAVIATMFEPRSRAWWSPGEIRDELSLAEYYLDHFFKSRDAITLCGEALSRQARDFFAAAPDNEGLVISGSRFASPASLFSAGPDRPYRSSILHRDLNSDNILVDPQDEAICVIDFQDVGRGHVYQDLIALEASVRINYPPTGSFETIWETERQIACREAGGGSYAEPILHIRSVARDCFGRIESRDNFHFAVAAVGLRLMHAKDLSAVALARITASTLWATKMLSSPPGQQMARA